MQIKRYEVLDIRDAIELIKKDLGEEAVIISTRQVSGSNDLGFFGKPFLEVVAAVDYNEGDIVPAKENKGFNQDMLAPIYDDVKFLKDNFDSIVEDKVIYILNSKLEEIKAFMNEIKFDLNLLKDERSHKGSSENDLLIYLDNISFERNISVKLIEIFFKDIKLTNFKKEEKVDYFKKFFKKIIEKKVERKKLKRSFDGKTIIALIGNSGSGKTATAAKLCSKFIFEKNQHVSLCSIDSVKIGGYETLKSYAEKLKIDFSVLKDPQGLNSFISNSPSDIIIIDTFAVNHNNLFQLNALAKFFDKLKGGINIELLLPAYIKHLDAVRAYESFRNKIGAGGVIISKTDESRGIGNLAGLLLIQDSTIDFITSGENVPEDIEEANVENIYSLFFPKPAEF
ncbi:MAG: flagellar biosynthesis protein FlhF [bacterium]